MADARRLKKTGAFFKHSQSMRPATIAKLIHLKISAAFSDAALPLSSAACALATRKSDTNKTFITKRKRRLRIIEPHSRERPGAVPAKCGAQFEQKAGIPWPPPRGAPRPVRRQRVPWPRLPRQRLWRALP